MLRTAVRGAWSRKRRLASTVLAVVLGVAFLTATLVVSASVRDGFRVAFTEANAGTDALVRGDTRLAGAELATTASIDATVIDAVRGVDGVAKAELSVEGYAQVLGRDGTALGGSGPPTIGAAWIADHDLNPFTLAEGRAPAGPDEVVIDRRSATDGDLAVGDTTTVLVPAPVEVTVVGIATFGTSDSAGGTTLAAFALPRAQELLLGDRAKVTGIVVQAEAGLGQDELVERLRTVVPGRTDILTGAELTAEQQADIEGDFLGFFETALLVFAGVALLVAAFSIYNTFTILAAHRTREAALLRTLGASRSQILGSGVLEAVLVGAVGSLLGLAAGVGVAQGLLALFETAGFGMPIAGLRLESGAVLSGLVVGVVVTVASGLLPAWRAARVAPLAALREVAVDRSSSSRARLVIGVALAATGVGLVLSGTSGSGTLARAGLGAVVTVFGTVVLGPALARPIATVLGLPLGLRGIAGDLARRNAIRNPRRTAATSSALLVGVGVTTLFTIFGASVSASIERAVDRSFGGDLVVQASGWSGAGLSADLAAELASLDEVDHLAGLGWGSARLDGTEREITFTDPAALDAVTELGVVEGDLADLGPGQLAVSTKAAREQGWTLGQRVRAGFPDGAVEQLEVAVLYEDRAMVGNLLLPAATWEAHAAQLSYFVLMADLADGVPLEEGRAVVTDATAGHGAPSVRDRDEFVEAEAAEVAALLNVIYGLLAVAIVIAGIGIANTLSLAVHERTRELGLLRAVGQRRSELRAMVRWESALIATFGAAGGVAVGTFLAWGLVQALAAAEGLGTFALPITQLVVIVLAGAAVGIVAAIRPAWRASRLDVLAAVTTE